MLGIFGDESSDDDRNLMHKNIRYKEVNFVEKGGDDDDVVEVEEDKDDTKTHIAEEPVVHGLGFRQTRPQSRETSEDIEQDELRPTMGLGARHLGGLGHSNGRTKQQFAHDDDNDDNEESYRPAFGFNQSRSTNEDEHVFRPALGFNQSRSAQFESTFASHTTTQSDTMDTALPAAPKPSLLSARKAASTSSSRKYGVGASMLEKMGYKAGQGLGSEGQGILNPIETKLRPERMGLGGVKEMTTQAKEEARRRGQLVSDDDSTVRRKKKGMGGGGSGTSTPRGRTKKVMYQTAEELAGGMVVPATIQKLVDMQGREVDISSVGSGSGKMEDERRIAALARRDLERFGGEWRTLQEHRKYVDVEMGRMRDELALEEERIRKLEDIISRLQQIGKSATGQGQVGLSQVSDGILDLQRKLESDDVSTFGVDEAIIGILQPMIKQILVDWDPLVDATASALTTFFKSWGSILRIRTSYHQETEIEAESSLFHTQSMLIIPVSSILIYRSTPYESILYHSILPKIRSAINNSWTPYDPQPVITLLEVWSPILPGFIHNLLLEQVIIPKLRNAIDHWNPRRGDSVHLWIFPWLPYLGMHIDDLVQTVRHKFKIVLETWDVTRGVVAGLEEWRELFGKTTLEDLLLKHILPKLALELRENFVVDPSDQKIDVLENVVFPWKSYFRASTWGQLLESEFFSKWLGMLHVWLTSEGVDLSEVGQWYEWWKHSVFPPDVLEMDVVRGGFKAGLDLMSKAADYVDQGIPLTKLAPPVTVQGRRTKADTKPVKKTPALRAVARPAVEETTFRDVLEDFCAENNLLFISMRTANEDGKPLFRITAHADGKGGVVGYVGKGDVLYIQSSRQGPFKPEGLDRLPDLAEHR